MSMTDCWQGHLHSARYPEVHLRYLEFFAWEQSFNCMKSSFYPDGVRAQQSSKSLSVSALLEHVVCLVVHAGLNEQ